jgi:hypothetical protein
MEKPRMNIFKAWARQFKQELHGFFRTLKRKSYILQAALPSQGMDTPLITTGDNSRCPLESDKHIVQTLKHANEYFLLPQQEGINSSSATEAKYMLVIKRPTFLLRLS